MAVVMIAVLASINGAVVGRIVDNAKDTETSHLGANNTAAAVNVALLDRESGEIVATKTIAEPMPTATLTSEMPDEAWTELEQIRITGKRWVHCTLSFDRHEQPERPRRLHLHRHTYFVCRQRWQFSLHMQPALKPLRARVA